MKPKLSLTPFALLEKSGISSARYGTSKEAISRLPMLGMPSPASYLLARLRHEKHRADHSNISLSVALFRYNKKPNDLGNFSVVAERLQSRIRETDIFGYLTEDTIAILLPNTDEKGTQDFIERVSSGYEYSHFSIITGTYPSQLFRDLLTKDPNPYVINLIQKTLEKSNAEKLWYMTSSLQTDPISTSYFLDQLQHEKRRADRCNTSLSIVLFDLNNQKHGKSEPFKTFLERLQKNLRETDILGYPDENVIGILLPDTDEKRMQEFIKTISDDFQENLPASIVAKTYPDHLFDNFLTRDKRQSKDCPLFLDSATEFNQFEYPLKRTLDIIGALIGIALFMPLMLIIAVVVKATSPGPVIFKQTRLGKRGIPFVFYKFRSMFRNTDDRIHREYTANLIKGDLQGINQGDEEAPLYKIKSDPRVTRIGRFIRKTSIDELPQLFNVLKGEMSLVGPRPPLPYEVEKYQSWHLRRVLEVKPGITGLWQVEGRSKTSFDEMVRLDLKYIRNCSFKLDLKLLVKTFKVVFRSSGAW